MLVIDIGNSRVKWRYSVDGSSAMTGSEVYDDLSPGAAFEAWFGAQDIVSPVVICSVADKQVNDAFRLYFEERNLTVVFVRSRSAFAGVTNGYKEPERLGVDRWVALVSAFEKYRSAVCVIDAGTAVTIDVVDNRGQHLGGMILPGLRLMKQSLLSATAGIQDLSEPHPGLLSDNTSDAVTSGCEQLLANGVVGLIEKINREYGLHTTNIVTGGDGRFLVDHLGSEYKLDQWLILDGLERLFSSQMIDEG